MVANPKEVIHSRPDTKAKLLTRLEGLARGGQELFHLSEEKMLL